MWAKSFTPVHEGHDCLNSDDSLEAEARGRDPSRSDNAEHTLGSVDASLVEACRPNKPGSTVFRLVVQVHKEAMLSAVLCSATLKSLTVSAETVQLGG